MVPIHNRLINGNCKTLSATNGARREDSFTLISTWSEIANVLLKDGLLTVDFMNNKLFQKLVDDGENEASEEEFNEWCSGHLVNR